jgi:hypothetical protein
LKRDNLTELPVRLLDYVTIVHDAISPGHSTVKHYSSSSFILNDLQAQASRTGGLITLLSVPQYPGGNHNIILSDLEYYLDTPL